MASPSKQSQQYKELFEIDMRPRLKDRRTASPESQPKLVLPTFPFILTLKEKKLLDSPEKSKIMDKQYLTHYILNILEEYTKSKKQALSLGDFLLSYLEQKLRETTSVKRMATNVALSIGQYASVSPEISFFYQVFSKREPSLKLIHNYLQCRKVVKTFLHNKEVLEGNRLSLPSWTSIVNKIFSKYPTDLVIDNIKEEITARNRHRALTKLNEKIKGEKQPRTFDLAVSLQAQKLDVEAIEFVVLCAEQLEGIKGEDSPYKRSVSPTKNTYQFTEETIGGGMFDYRSNARTMTGEKEILHDDSCNYSIITKQDEEHDDSSFLITEKNNRLPTSGPNSPEQEKMDLRKEIGEEMNEKNMSVEVMMWTLGAYEKMGRSNKLVHGFLKQIQKDFSFVVSYLKKNEPQVVEEIEKAFVERYSVTRNEDLNRERVKDVAVVEGNEKAVTKSQFKMLEQFDKAAVVAAKKREASPQNLKQKTVQGSVKVLKEAELIRRPVQKGVSSEKNADTDDIYVIETRKMLEELYEKILRDADILGIGGSNVKERNKSQGPSSILKSRGKFRKEAQSGDYRSVPEGKKE